MNDYAMKYIDTTGTEREVSRDDISEVYSALGTLVNLLSNEEIAEYFKRPMHDKAVYKTFQHGVETLRGLLADVAVAEESYAEKHGEHTVLG